MTQRKLTYRTTNLVHVLLTADLAERHGLVVEFTLPSHGVPGEGETEGLIYDLDYLRLNARDRQQLLGQLAGTPNAIPTAVHGDSLAEHEAEALRRNGVVVSRNLDDAFVAEVVAKVLGAHGPTAA